jgi:hypothetical protein
MVAFAWPPPFAHGLQAVADAVVPQRVYEGGHQAGARAAERVAAGDRAAVGVERLDVGADVGQPGQRDGRERLVDLGYLTGAIPMLDGGKLLID